MLKSKTISCWVVCLILLLFSLNIEAQNLIPLGLNNYWKYEQTTVENGKIISIDTVLNRVNGITTLNGKEWYLLNEFGDNFIVRNTAAGQMEIDTLSVNEDGEYDEIVMFKKPNKSKNLSYLAYDVNNVFIDKSPAIIKTSIGDYKCYKYIITTEGVENESIETFICPGIGIIYQDWVIDEKHIKSKLVDFKIE